MRQVAELLKSGELFPKYKDLIDVREQNGLTLLNYSRECQYSNGWDDITVACRGLIIDTADFSIAALPFPKFFNLGERPETQLENLPKLPFTIFEKIDGSLGILYRDRSSQACLATRGSFNSEQAIRGTEMLRQLPNLSSIPDELTFIFEIVYRENKSAVKYDFNGLVLLAIYNRVTGEELAWKQVCQWAEKINVRLPKIHSFGTLEQAMAEAKTLPANLEGFVIRFENGFRVKLKGEAFLALHKLIWDINENRVLELLIENKLEQLLRAVPEEFRLEIEALAKPLQEKAAALQKSAEEIFAKAPKGSRKEFALWIKENAPAEIQSAMFQLFNEQSPNWYKVFKK